MKSILLSLTFLISLAPSFANSKLPKKYNFENIANSTYRKFNNTLTIHITNPPKPLNWNKSPRKLLFGLVGNMYLRKKRTKRSIGHVTVELNCKKGKGIEHRFGGQGTVAMSDFTTKITKEGFGLNLILMPEHVEELPEVKNYPLLTIPGKFEEEETLTAEYNQSIAKQGLMGIITYKLQENTCHDLVSFFDQYKKITRETKGSKKPLAGNVYGFGVDPLKFEGAGCATFVGSFLRLAGLENEYRNMFQYLYPTQDLFKASLNSQKVSLSKLLSTNVKLGENNSSKFKIGIPSPHVLYKRVIKSLSSQDFDGLDILEKGQFGKSQAAYVVVDALK